MFTVKVFKVNNKANVAKVNPCTMSQSYIHTIA